MTKQKTHVALVLDRSGSMYAISQQAVQGYNEQIKALQESVEKENQEVTVSLVSFHSSVTEHFWERPVMELEEASKNDYSPSGWTALHDGMGYTIKKLMETGDPNDENTSYLVIVISDGEENSSKYYNSESINELISKLKGTGKWTFTFMGCDKNYLKEVAQSTGIPLANCAVWDNSSAVATEFANKGSVKNLKKYMKARSMGVQHLNCYHSEDSFAFADFSQGTTLDSERITLSSTSQASGDNSKFLKTMSIAETNNATESKDTGAKVFSQGTEVEF
jgi:uncharacterized protein YegL